MYTAIIIILITIGLTASTFYVFTWGYGAAKAAYYRTTVLTKWELVDFALYPFAAWLILTINALNILQSGVPEPSTTGFAIQRVTTTVLIVTIVMIRLIRWGIRYFKTPREQRGAGAALVERPHEEAS